MDYIIDVLLRYKLLNTLMLGCGFVLYCLLKYIYDVQKLKETHPVSRFHNRVWLRNNCPDLLAALIMTVISYVVLYLRGSMTPEIAAAVGVAGTYVFSIIYKTIALTLSQIAKR
jgi:hypothetical protein